MNFLNYLTFLFFLSLKLFIKRIDLNENFFQNVKNV